MRLKQQEIKIIKDTVSSFFNDVSIYLFGSRLDDSKKGGDIDLFIISNDKDLFAKKIKTIAKLKRLLHKPVDILLHTDFNRDIEKEALKGVEF